MMQTAPKIVPPLDPLFQPVILADRDHQRRAKVPLVIGIESPAALSRCETVVDPDAPDALRYVERLVKFLLWARGGWKLYLGGPRALMERVQVRRFDAELMGQVYERSCEVVVMEAKDVPAERKNNAALGGHLDGQRLGFDLGASDYKVAALNEGTVVYSEEFPWNPKEQPDPQYHYEHINKALRKAAGYLPRVDAIGGSTAGVVVDNRLMVASLLRTVPAADFPKAQKIFLRLRDEWKVPLEVANDGDVTALAGAMSLKAEGVLGVAMGSSQAAGYLDRKGSITGWLSELAFVPVDCNPQAPVDEWSGERAVGALYFSQQAVNKLLPVAGIAVKETGLPERLKEVQALMAEGDPRAARVYETLGVYLGYTIPYYANFYDFSHLLVLGRVTTGEGGSIMLNRARAVLEMGFPEVFEKITLHVPDEKSRRIGQAVAAASLPVLKKESR